MLQDVETQELVNVSPDYLEGKYRERLNAHLEALRASAASVGAHQMLVSTADPLDDALRRYLSFRQGRN